MTRYEGVISIVFRIRVSGGRFGAHDTIETNMGELDEAWAAALSEAEHRARLAGRKDVAEYLALRNSNDLLRQAGVDWLVNGFTVLAGEANRAGASIQISTKDGHRFPVGSSTMVGHLLTLINGVRTLYVEAGWPRVPRDGFVRGGGLANANIRHLGLRSASQELLLTKTSTGAPSWKSLSSKPSELREWDLRRHLAILLDQR